MFLFSLFATIFFSNAGTATISCILSAKTQLVQG